MRAWNQKTRDGGREAMVHGDADWRATHGPDAIFTSGPRAANLGRRLIWVAKKSPFVFDFQIK